LLFGRCFLLVIEEDLEAVRPAKGYAAAAEENPRKPMPVGNFSLAGEATKRKSTVAVGIEILHLISDVSARDAFSLVTGLAPTSSLGAAVAEEITAAVPS